MNNLTKPLHVAKISVKLLQQLYASFTKPLRAESINLPLQINLFAPWKVCLKLDDHNDIKLVKTLTAITHISKLYHLLSP